MSAAARRVELPTETDLDRFKPKDKVHYKFNGQVPTFDKSGVILEGEGQIVRKMVFQNDPFYIIDNGVQGIMIREEEISLA